MKNNLVIGSLGHRYSGKSTTRYELFEEKVKTGSNFRKLYLKDISINLENSILIEKFFILGSFTVAIRKYIGYNAL